MRIRNAASNGKKCTQHTIYVCLVYVHFSWLLWIFVMILHCMNLWTIRIDICVCFEQKKNELTFRRLVSVVHTFSPRLNIQQFGCFVQFNAVERRSFLFIHKSLLNAKCVSVFYLNIFLDLSFCKKNCFFDLFF